MPIAIQRISKAYGAVTALDQVTLSIECGEFVSLLGPSGSGKTTLLMVLAGFVRPDRGQVHFGDADVTRLPPHQREVGMVFQNYALFPHMDVFGNVSFPLRLRGLTKPEIKGRVGWALDLVRLGALQSRRMDQLSGGQRQRVALARAIVFKPRILLMDEPLSALDKQLRERMQIEIRRLHEQLGMTTVYVTHDQREALTMSDRVALINEGRIVQVDSPQHLYERPVNRFAAEFIGESTLLPVERTSSGFTLYGRELRIAAEPAGGGRFMLLLRPEKVQIIDDGAGAADMNVVEGSVRDIVFQGDSFLLYVDLRDGVEMTMRKATTRQALAAVPSPGSRIALGLSIEDTLLISTAAT